MCYLLSGQILQDCSQTGQPVLCRLVSQERSKLGNTPGAERPVLAVLVVGVVGVCCLHFQVSDSAAVE